VRCEAAEQRKQDEEAELAQIAEEASTAVRARRAEQAAMKSGSRTQSQAAAQQRKISIAGSSASGGDDDEGDPDDAKTEPPEPPAEEKVLLFEYDNFPTSTPPSDYPSRAPKMNCGLRTCSGLPGAGWSQTETINPLTFLKYRSPGHHSLSEQNRSTTRRATGKKMYSALWIFCALLKTHVFR